MEQQMWTLVIAVGGLVIALISFGWNIFLHVASRPKIKVTASIMRMYPTPIGLSDDAEVLILGAVNLRSRPVTIKGFYGEYCKPRDGKRHFWIKGSCQELAQFASTLPLQIKEGDEAKLMTLVDSMDDLSNVKFFFAGDTTGKDWYSRKHPLRRHMEKRDQEERDSKFRGKK